MARPEPIFTDAGKIIVIFWAIFIVFLIFLKSHILPFITSLDIPWRQFLSWLPHSCS